MNDPTIPPLHYRTLEFKVNVRTAHAAPAVRALIEDHLAATYPAGATVELLPEHVRIETA